MADSGSRTVPTHGSPNRHLRTVPGQVSPTPGGVSLAVLMPHLVRSVIFLALVVISMVVWMVGIGFGILGGMGMVGGGGFTLGPDIDSGLTVLGVAGIAFFGLILFAGVREVVDEGSVLVEGA